MNTTEIRKIISKSTESEWFNTKTVQIEYPHIGFSIDLKGIPSIHKFLSQQVKGWSKYDDLPSQLTASKNHFNNLKNRIEAFVNNNHSQSTQNIINHWRNENNELHKHGLSNIDKFFTFDAAETEFLIDVYNKLPHAVNGAFLFTIGEYKINNKNDFIGAILAYEFEIKDNSDLTTRAGKEKKSISRIRNDFQNLLSESQSDLNEHFSETEKLYSEYIKKIDEYKTEKEGLFDSWFDSSKSKFDEFAINSNSDLENLEATYKEKLKLEEPALYWEERAKKLQKQGWISLAILIASIAIVVWSLGEILWETPDQIYKSFFGNDKSAAIRWSIVYITFISFMAYGIRAITKVMFSSFHLARDCQERFTLTYFYLSLSKDTSVDEKERLLIMQSLFSRADTGLLKEDSSPTMPNDLIGKIFASK